MNSCVTEASLDAKLWTIVCQFIDGQSAFRSQIVELAQRAQLIVGEEQFHPSQIDSETWAGITALLTLAEKIGREPSHERSECHE